MSLLPRLSSIWRNLLRNGHTEQELTEEVESYLDLLTESKIKQGLKPDEARRAALIEMGGVEQVKERVREARMGYHLETIGQDLRYAARMLLRKPGFTAVAIVMLALGIGANTTVFSVVNGVLLKALPYPEPERVVAVYETSKEVPVMSVAYPNYLDWRAQQDIFEHLAARMPAGGVLTGEGEPERITGRYVTSSFFPTLGVQPQVGRYFNEEEDRPGGPALMVLNHGLWQRRFGGDPNVIGRAIQYNSESWTVIGVMSAGFDFYGQNNLNNQFFIPMGRIIDQEYMRDRRSHPVAVTGRLKSGVTIEQAQAEMEAIAARLEQQHPASNTGNSVKLLSLLEDQVGDARPSLLVLTAAVGLVLLIVCVNVANLLLARATARRKEIAVRMAIGAGRPRIVRQLLTESILLGIAGGTFGLLLARWGVDLLVRLNPDSMPRLDEISLDSRVLGFTLLVTLLTAVIFGLVPALQTIKVDLQDALRESGRQSSGGGTGQRLRDTLVVVEVALSLVLLVGAGLLMRSFWQLSQVDAGFDARNVLTIRLRLPDVKYPEAAQTMGFLKEVMRRVAALPGVEQVSVGTGFPLGPARENGYWIEGQPEPKQPGDWPVAITQSVSETYHQTLNIALLAGRLFTDRDTADSPPVVIVDEDFVRRHFPGGPPSGAIGKRLRFGGATEPWREVVGVVRHVRHYGPEQEGRAGIYRPWTQMNPRWLANLTRAMDLVVKTSVEPTGLVAAIKQEVQSLDKDQPLANVQTLESLLARSIAPRRFSLLMFSVFAFTALLLGAVGLYGVISYTVTQRTREIGIRIAFGAEAKDIVGLVLGRGMILTLAGIIAGLVAAFASTRLMAGLLYGVSATDPAVFVGITLLLAVVALTACYVPARRATKVDPMSALRHE